MSAGEQSDSELIFDASTEEYDFWRCALRKPNEDDVIADFLPPNAREVLDVGCGSGQTALHLADRAAHVTGIDSSPEMIHLALRKQERQGKSNVTFLQAAVETWPCAPERFDFIMSDMTLHHVDPNVVLPLLCSWLRPGGRIFVRDIVAVDIRSWRNPLWQYRKAWRELREFKARSRQEWWRAARFGLSPTWIRHVCRENVRPVQEMREIYRRHFPGCTWVDLKERMLMLWEKSDA